MPSPLAHATVGCVLYRVWPERHDPTASRRVLRLPALLLAGVGLSLLPDTDAIAGILAGNLGRYHNQFMGSPVFGALAALAVAAAARLFGGRAGRWFLLALCCYEAHVLMDFLTVGRGVMLVWPLSEQRFRPPFEIFYGLRWSDGLWSVRHLWTLFSESLFAAVVLAIAWWATRRRRRCGSA